MIALKAGAPIVPVSVTGSLAVLPKGSLRIRPGSITVRYGAGDPGDGGDARDQGAAHRARAVRRRPGGWPARVPPQPREASTRR
mgnify:CR=1 FL=1